MGTRHRDGDIGLLYVRGGENSTVGCRLLSHVAGLAESHGGVSTILCQKNLTALLRRRRRADCRGVPAARRVRVATDKSRIIGVYPMRCIPFVFTRRDLTSHTHIDGCFLIARQTGLV